MHAWNASTLTNLTDGLTRSESLLTASVIEGKPKQTTTVLTAGKRACTVCPCAFACVRVSDQCRLASALGGIYAKLIQQSFPSDFQDHSFHAGILLTWKRRKKNTNTHLFMLLQMQTLAVNTSTTTPSPLHRWIMTCVVDHRKTPFGVCFTNSERWLK